MSYFVLVVNDRGVPNKMTGPVEWDRGVALVLEAVASEKVELTQEVRDAVDMDGHFEFDDGGGVFLVMADEDNGHVAAQEEKTVAIVIADRDSSKTVQDTAHFSSWKQLKDDVDLLIKDSGFRKVNVDLTASWATSDEDDDMIAEIENG